MACGLGMSWSTAHLGHVRSGASGEDLTALGGNQWELVGWEDMCNEEVYSECYKDKGFSGEKRRSKKKDAVKLRDGYNSGNVNAITSLLIDF